MKVELFISWRYLVTKRQEKFISLISIISILGLAIGVMALIVVLGVMSGFDRDLRDKIVGNYSHITLSGQKPLSGEEIASIRDKIATQPHVTGISPYVQGQVLLKEENKFFAVGLRGINPQTEEKVTKLKTHLVAGNLESLGAGSIIVGKELAGLLGLRLGSTVLVYSALGKQNALKVVGIFASGMYDYDLNLVFTSLETSQDILGMPGLFSAVAIKLDDLYSAGKVRDELSRVLGFRYYMRTWMELNQNFFAALKLEKLAMFIILTLIVLVAAFNIISTLVVMVVDKTRDIGILKAQGMTAASIRKIFICEGLLIGGMGTFFGVAGGLALCGLLKKFKFIQLPQDIYYLDRLPVAVELWPDITLIVMAALIITLLSTVYPALKASRLNPVEALRYE